jgi:excisionase family DNA binding protein
MELLTVCETAKLLRLSTNRVYALIKQGVLPSVRVVVQLESYVRN